MQLDNIPPDNTSVMGDDGELKQEADINWQDLNAKLKKSKRRAFVRRLAGAGITTTFIGIPIAILTSLVILQTFRVIDLFAPFRFSLKRVPICITNRVDVQSAWQDRYHQFNQHYSPDKQFYVLNYDSPEEAGVKIVENNPGNKLIKTLYRTTNQEWISPNEALWSPDGAHIGFVVTADDSDRFITHLYITNVDDTDQQSISDAPYIHLIGWSPNSGWLAFSHTYEKDSRVFSRIFITNYNGTVVRELTREPLEGYLSYRDNRGLYYSSYGGLWSPDSKSLLISFSIPYQYGGFPNDVLDTANDSYVIRIEDSTIIELRDVPIPSNTSLWMPNGTDILYIGVDSGLYTIHTNEKTPRMIVENWMATIGGVSLDGKYIIFSAYVDSAIPSQSFRIDAATLSRDSICRLANMQAD